MRRESIVEKIKTTTIVVLFLSAVLLLYFFWKGFSLEDIKLPISSLPSSHIDVPTADMLVEPRNVQLTFGADNYTLFSANTLPLWQSFMKEYIAFSESENVFVEEITPSKWRESMLMKSIRYEFSYNVPFSYLDSLGAANIPQAEAVTSFSIIGYSIASKESIFVYDKKNNKYYRMVSDADYTNLDSQISALEQEPHSPYYPINMFYGVNNDTLLPYDLQASLQPLSAYYDEGSDLAKDIERRIAEKFFGQSLDFIRKITEDAGTIIYMYGVGQKILTIDPEGQIKYTEELNNNYNPLSYFKSLDLAANFAANHSDKINFSGNDLESYLEYSTKLSLEGKKEGYRFAFGLKQDNYPLYSADGPQIIVEVIGDQVIYYKGNIHTAHKTSPEDVQTTMMQASPIIEILPNSYNMLATILQEYGVEIPASTPDEQFNAVIERITAVSDGYFQQQGEEPGQIRFVPAWVIHLSSVDVFFDLYTGEYLGYADEGMR